MNYVERAQRYSKSVVAGEIDACKWVKAACQRQMDDLEAFERGEFDYIWDEARAMAPCAFIEVLPHIKGKWAGSPIRLEDWQCFILTTVFGWVDAEGYRRYRTVYIEVPRKNAKSTLSSGVGLYMAFADGEGGAEVYSAATTREQAGIVFKDAWRMARHPSISGALKKRFGVSTTAHSVHNERTASLFRALSAEGSTLDGLNIHCAIVDELHAHKTRSVWDVLETATGSRTQSLIWAITTAGTDQSGICYEVRTYLTKILDGVVEDDSMFGIVYSLDDGDDWTDEGNWQKANPNYGVSVFPLDIKRLAKKAAEMPAAQNNFLTKRLNVWCSASTAWMNMLTWKRCADPSLSINEFRGLPCYVGIDLATKVDMAAGAVVFPRGGKYYLFCKYWLPEETVRNSANSQYSGWAREGLLETTPGNVIDYTYIEDWLRMLADQFEVRAVGYDPFHATQFATGMLTEGFPMVEVRPTVMNFSEPMKSLEAFALEGKLGHDGDPILSWMVSNVVCKFRGANGDDIYPVKERPENKIDGVVASLMALGRAMFTEQETYVVGRLVTL